MKAIICTKYGPPEVLQLKEIEKPVPKKNEVLIKIKTTSVTASDCIVRGFKLPLYHPIGFLMGLVLGFGKPRNPILGMVLAGQIESLGKDVKLFKPGEEVIAWTIKSPLKINSGTYAEFKCLPEDSVMTLKPAKLSFEDAVSIPYGGLLAIHFIKKGNIKKQQKVLIYGASGAIGTNAVQLAKYYGAEVTGVCSTANLELVKSLGADKVVDYTNEKVSDFNEKYDFILDAVGKRKSSDLKKHIKKLLAPKGKIISVDDGNPVGTIENLKLLIKLNEEGILQTVVDRIYSLDQMVEAHRYVDAGHKKGNVVIIVN